MDWNFLKPPLERDERILLKRYATLGGSTWGSMYVTTTHIRFVSKSLALRRQNQRSRRWPLEDVASVSRVEQENGRTLFTWNGLQGRIRIIFSTHEAIYFNEDSRYIDDTLHKIRVLTTNQADIF